MYQLIATNHGLSNIPCNLSRGCFGEYEGIGEYSRLFETREEAEAAKSSLETSGDWPDGAPDYDIEEVEIAAGCCHKCGKTGQVADNLDGEIVRHGDIVATLDGLDYLVADGNSLICIFCADEE